MTCPLDGFATADRAYGMVQLYTAYTGPLVVGCDAAGTTTHDFYPAADGWVDPSEVEAFAATVSGGNVFVKTRNSQNGVSADCTYNASNIGDSPPMLAVAGVCVRMINDGVSRPATLKQAGVQGAGHCAGGNYALNPAGKRFTMLAVLSQWSTDAQAGGSNQRPAGSALMSTSYSGGSGSDLDFLAYGGGRATANAPQVLFEHNGPSNRSLSASWSTDAIHTLTTRRNADTSVDAWADGALQETVTVGNVTGITTSDLYLDMAGGTGFQVDSYRSCVLAHWQSDIGAVEVVMHAALAAAIAPAVVTGTAHVSLRPRINLPPARVGAQHLSPSAARFLTGTRVRQ
jgi:hypothetical protein